MIRVATAALAALALAACFNPSFDHPQCGPAGECPSGSVCVGGTCQDESPDIDAPIDTPTTSDGGPDAPVDAPIDAAIDAPIDAAIDSAIDAPNPSCGDGNIDLGEQCDDGNQVDTDACVRCRFAVCGDGFVHNGGFEACDDGNLISTDACLNTCVAAFCGDGFIRGGVEVCDDRNGLACGTCNAGCTATVAARNATGTVQEVSASLHQDGDLLIIDDGVSVPVQFEYDTIGNGVAGGHVPVMVAGLGAGQTATQVINAINTQGPLRIIAGGQMMGLFTLSHDLATGAGNRPLIETVASSLYVVSGMSGGGTADCLAGVGCMTNADCLSGVCSVANSQCQ